MVPCSYLEEVRGPATFYMSRLLAAATRVSGLGVGSGAVSAPTSGLQSLGAVPADATVEQPIPSLSYTSVTMPATSCKFASPAVKSTLAAMHKSVSRSFVLGVTASHLFLRAVFAAGLHFDPEAADVVSTQLYDAFQRAAAYFNPGHAGSQEDAFAQWPALDMYWRWALGRVAAAAPPPPHGDTLGDAEVLRAAIHQFFSVNVRGVCGGSLDSVCRQLIDRAARGVVSAAVAKDIVKGNWTALSKARRTAFAEINVTTGSRLSLLSALSLYFAVREGSRLHTDKLVQRVRHGLCGGREDHDDDNDDDMVPDVPAPLGEPPDPAVGDGDRDEELSLGKRQRLCLRVFGALALRWEAQAAACTALQARLRDAVHANVKVKGGRSATGAPSFLPMPRPQAVAIRVCGSDVPAILRRAQRLSGDSEGTASDFRTANLMQLFDPTNHTIAAHVRRYGDLGSSVLFTGGGLRFLVPRLSVGFVVASVTDAAEWRGTCKDVLKPPPTYVRPLYGKDALEPRSPEEVRSKQRAFLLGKAGPYLMEDHLTPQLLHRYFVRTGARASIGDPGVSALLAFWDGSFISLRALYKFLACAYHRDPKPDSVLAAEAALSGTSPRGGVAGLAAYATELAKVGGEGRVPTT